ncbi:caveolin-2-like [Euwallacea fornicatus]|uniref:caveolin-2-like n=1 Tax=Euwallacea fornicatus TaxID=995702 RepID=UPI00338EEA5F
MSKSESEIADLEDRDPEKINRHLEVPWENLIGEPQSIRSPECAWSLSKQCFRCSRIGVYTCLSVLCGPIAAFLIGLCYAIFYFLYIWCATPSLWFIKISCGVTRSFVRAFTQGFLAPLMGAFGHIFAHIKVRTGPVEERGDVNEEDKLSIV